MYEGKSVAEEIKILLNDARKKAKEKARENENKIKLKNFDILLKENCKLRKEFQNLNDIFKELTGQNLNKETLQIEIIILKNKYRASICFGYPNQQK